MFKLVENAVQTLVGLQLVKPQVQHSTLPLPKHKVQPLVKV
jgi:hypothetical protein